MRGGRGGRPHAVVGTVEGDGRLIAYLRFDKQIVYIKALLTYGDYEKAVWKP